MHQAPATSSTKANTGKILPLKQQFLILAAKNVNKTQSNGATVKSGVYGAEM